MNLIPMIIIFLGPVALYLDHIRNEKYEREAENE